MSVINEKKKALLAYKNKILQEIKDCEQNIEDFRANHKNNIYFDSSDSEDDWLPNISRGPKIPELKLQQTQLKTCLQATLELTGLTVLQSEVNVLVADPNIENEPPVQELGTWREVTAECRIDLVPFSITFLQHTPHRKFGGCSYRGLRVVVVKATHDAELANSVLHTLTRPSDAVEVLRSYAAAYRSRRITLARLADKFASSLFMEPHQAEGGFLLKCANLLEVCWRLENKWSPVAAFHHKMKFDLEYMDESYIKRITQSHKQLSDPSLQTDERTLLLSNIISICLEARGPIDPQEGVESDLESKTTDNDLKRDSEVMAPPKSVPKKLKTKTTAPKRSNTDDNNDNAKKKRLDNDSNEFRDVKGSNHNEMGNARNITENRKRSFVTAKDNSDNNIESVNNHDARIRPNRSVVATKSKITPESEDGKDDNTEPPKDPNDKNKPDQSNKFVLTQKKSSTAAHKANAGSSESPTDDVAIDKTKKNIATAKKSNAVVPKVSNAKDNALVSTSKGVNTEKNKAERFNTLINSAEAKKKPQKVDSNMKHKNKTNNVAPIKIMRTPDDAELIPGVNNTNVDKAKTVKDINKAKHVPKLANPDKAVDSQSNTAANGKDKQKVKSNTKNSVDLANTKRIIHNENPDANVKVATDRTKNAATAKTDTTKSIPVTSKSIQSLTAKNNGVTSNTKSTNSIKTKEALTKSTVNNVQQILNTATEKHANVQNKDKISQIVKEHKSDKLINKNLKLSKIIQKGQMKSRNFPRTGNIVVASKILKPSNTGKENEGKISKIPRKILTPVSEKSKKVNPLRISPRLVMKPVKKH